MVETDVKEWEFQNQKELFLCNDRKVRYTCISFIFYFMTKKGIRNQFVIIEYIDIQ